MKWSIKKDNNIIILIFYCIIYRRSDRHKPHLHTDFNKTEKDNTVQNKKDGRESNKR